MPAPKPSSNEVFFDSGDIIVSKTNLKGQMTYVNKVFCAVADYQERDLIGQPHSMIRHPDMPRSVFKLLWDTIKDRREIFAYVKNRTRTGGFYWVFAHVTPSLDGAGEVIGFHSNRRVPDRALLARSIIPLYAELLSEEQRHKNGKDALAAGYAKLQDFISAQKMSYDQLIFSL